MARFRSFFFIYPILKPNQTIENSVCYHRTQCDVLDTCEIRDFHTHTVMERKVVVGDAVRVARASNPNRFEEPAILELLQGDNGRKLSWDLLLVRLHTANETRLRNPECCHQSVQFS